MKKILIIEDDRQLQQIFLEKLTHKGYQVIQSYASKEGFKEAKAYQPDLILLDIMFPTGITGFEVLELLKKDLLLNKIPVLVLTNLDNKLNAALKAGATWYFTKVNTPIDEVIKSIEEYLK